MSKLLILANKASGLEGCAFSMSAVLEVVKRGNVKLKFKFPFWGFTITQGHPKGDEWINEKEYKEVSENILKFLNKQNNFNYFKKIKKQITADAKKIKREAKLLLPLLPVLNNEELVMFYNKFMENYISYYAMGIITFIYETYLSDKLMNSLLMRYKQATKILPSILNTSYRSFMLQNELAIKKIAKTKKVELKERLIKQYLKDFFFMRTNYMAAPLVTEEYIKEEIKSLNKKKVFRLKKININLLMVEKKIINLLRISEIIRDQRKLINLIGTFTAFRFLEEASRRSKINIELAKDSFWFEFKEFFNNKSKLLNKLKKRKNISLVYYKKSCYYTNELILQEKEKINEAIKEIKGTPASAGKIKGKVRLVLNRRHFLDFKQGEILVAQMTRPEYLPIMKKAGAIITDEGGLTSHAAIVARELRIPCVIGTKIATRVLQNNQEIEIDANKGIISIIK